MLVHSLTLVISRLDFSLNFCGWFLSFGLWQKSPNGQSVFLTISFFTRGRICPSSVNFQSNFHSSWGFLISLWTSKVLLKTLCDFYSFQYSVTYHFEAQCVARVMSFFFKHILPWNFRIILVFSHFSFATTTELSRSVGNWNKLRQRPRWKYFSWKSKMRDQLQPSWRENPWLVWYGTWYYKNHREADVPYPGE